MKKAFTIIELIFVIVILGILAAVAIPKLQKVHDKSTTPVKEKTCDELLTDANTYKQLALHYKQELENKSKELEEVSKQTPEVQLPPYIAPTSTPPSYMGGAGY